MLRENIELLKSTIDNPFTRYFFSKLGYCEKCQGNRLEIALELYLNTRQHACFACSATESLLARILNISGKFFGTTQNDLKDRFKDPYWRKGLANVISGIATFGVNKPFIPGAPFLVVWDVTKKCNLNCKHCYADAGSDKCSEMSTEKAKKVIDILNKNSVPIISFSGGEPLVRNDIFELTKYASDKGIYVGMATNGTLITEEKAKKMKESGIQFVQISLDGATAEFHDQFRGQKGMFDKTIQGIKNCVKEDFFVNIATVATQKNYQQIPDIINICNDLHVKWFMMYNFVPVGRGEAIIDTDLTPFQREELLRSLWTRIQNEDINVNLLSTAPQFARVALENRSDEHSHIIPSHFYNTSFSGDLDNLAEFIGGCGCGRFYCAIRTNGDIEPCVFFPLKLGNIFEDNLLEIWEHNNILHDLRNREILDAACGECKYKYYCGGCRARAYGYTGNYLSADPGCINNVKQQKAIVEAIIK